MLSKERHQTATGPIQDLLDEVRRKDAALEWFFAEEREEPVIVKNLENIQGDERDMILFSITFGPDQAGKLTMNFGALNSDGGERRLNVAVTRARQEMHVYASITHDQIDLSRTHAQGVKDLKTFLDYAERGAVALPARDEGSVGPADSPFEETVAAAFQAKGWEVRTQIGVSGFRVDLGIVNPDRGGAYLAGIECDGATYHSSATARDRDKVRQAVLEGLGWSILRIWSTEWFRNRRAVVERLHRELEAALEADRARRATEATEAPFEDEPAVTETPAALPSPEPQPATAADAALQTSSPPQESVPVYAARADSGFTAAQDETQSELSQFLPNQDLAADEAPVLDPEAFYDAEYLPQLRRLIQQIAEAQAPLSLSQLNREVAARHGWQRAGGRIQAQVSNALDAVDTHQEFETTFVWLRGGYKDRVAFRGLSGRSIHELSRTEIATVLDACGLAPINDEEGLQKVKEALGIGRLTHGIRDYILNCDNWRRVEG